MMEIFLLQLLAVGLGGLSTAWAGHCYNRARIGGRLHAFWVSSSAAASCLPVVAWTAIVFCGPGVLGQSIAGTLVGAIFCGVYRNLPYAPPGGDLVAVTMAPSTWWTLGYLRRRGLNNRAENSHQPTRRREQQMKQVQISRSGSTLPLSLRSDQ